MLNDVNLNSDAWCELVFEGKNKAYGAYYLRKTSSRRHLRALLIIILVGLLAVFLPLLIKTVMPKEQQVMDVGAVELSNLENKQEVPEEHKVELPEALPPPDLMKTIANTPAIVPDDKVKDEDIMKSQDDLMKTEGQISTFNVEGKTDGTGADLAEIEEHKVVVQAPKEEVYDMASVEEPPMFPGGDAARSEWLTKNIVFPQIALENGVNGKVILEFVVDKEGNVTNVKVAKTLDPSCDREAVNKVSKMPKWSPGKQNGHPVAVKFYLPVNFSLRQRN